MTSRVNGLIFGLLGALCLTAIAAKPAQADARSWAGRWNGHQYAYSNEGRFSDVRWRHRDYDYDRDGGRFYRRHYRYEDNGRFSDGRRWQRRDYDRDGDHDGWRHYRGHRG